MKVHATAVTFGECIARDFTFPASRFWLPLPLLPLAKLGLGWSKPRRRIMGSETAGQVESVGRDVKTFKPGDPVFGFSPGFGANAEYLCLPEDGVVAIRPANLTYEESAVVPHGGMTALHFMRRANIQSGDKVLVNGASGGIGQYAVQLAKSYGAEVTGVCRTAKLEHVKSLGADHVIDYTQEDLTRNRGAYDVVLDTARVTGFSRVRGSLKQDGRYLLAVFGGRELLQMLWTSMVGNKKVVCGLAPTTKERLNEVKGLVEAGAIKPVIDRSYPLEQIAAAHRYFGSGERKGYVVVTVADGGLAGRLF